MRRVRVEKLCPKTPSKTYFNGFPVVVLETWWLKTTNCFSISNLGCALQLFCSDLCSKADFHFLLWWHIWQKAFWWSRLWQGHKEWMRVETELTCEFFSLLTVLFYQQTWVIGSEMRDQLNSVRTEVFWRKIHNMHLSPKMVASKTNGTIRKCSSRAFQSMSVCFDQNG
jgi:hypothetical protein